MAQGSAVSWKTSHTDNGWMFAKIWTCVWMTETDLHNLSLLGSDITILLPFLLSRNGKKAKFYSYWIFLRPAMSILSDKFHWSEIATWQLSNLTGFYLSSLTFRHNFRIFHPSFIIFGFLVGFTIRFSVSCVPKCIQMFSPVVWKWQLTAPNLSVSTTETRTWRNIAIKNISKETLFSQYPFGRVVFITDTVEPPCTSTSRIVSDDFP